MCKDDADFLPHLAPAVFDGGETCAEISDYVLASIPDLLSWNDTTCSDLAAGLALDDDIVYRYMIQMGGECCGGRDKVRCLDSSTMCSSDADFQPDLAPAVFGGETTCGFVSSYLMTFFPGKLNWGEITCADIEGLGSLRLAFLGFGEQCCGGRHLMRCADESSMCRFVQGAVDADLMPNAAFGSQSAEGEPLKCSLGELWLLSSLGKIKWSDVTSEMVANATTVPEYSDFSGASGAVPMAAALATHGPCCCGVAGVCHTPAQPPGLCPHHRRQPSDLAWSTCQIEAKAGTRMSANSTTALNNCLQNFNITPASIPSSISQI